MFHIQAAPKRWDKLNSPKNKADSTCKTSQVEPVDNKSSQFAKAKTTEYISNTQQVYYLERRLFG
ncbi:hypothetical protein I8748_01450 [Nostoc sp. CENA67]|uniref:Uncharacterized protein n=1 Tax=Amazonocrinis nigriterrae CENA67 TaxID=2794033 RepID=A0A8J7L8Y5_9NOST|nr:hypothetical protein [Amazonocrinis nigriterrae]MBH8560856.1 hypothetical protein [Amazonocrinis nigriterrae CENA67]